MKILIAEDSKAMALPVIAYLEQKGHQVTHVINGRAALESFQAAPPDIILMDVEMPEMDGLEATRQIKALDPSHWTPVLMMTGLTATGDLVAGLSSGADDYITKPIVFEILEARIMAMQRILILQRRLASILDNVYEGIITIDKKGHVLNFNRAAERTFGYVAAEVVGRNVNMLMPSPYTEEHDGYLARYERERTPHVIGIGRKVSGRRKDGEEFPLRLSVTEVWEGDDCRFIGLVKDISEEEAAQARIEFLALYDPLTGLPNRVHFNEVLDETISHQDKNHALLFIDLDGFKAINDKLGHDAGDEALKQVATRIRHNLAANDFAARLGGDEIVAIARDIVGRNSAMVIADRVIQAIAEPMVLSGGRTCQLGASIGISLIPEHGLVASELITAADSAMYQAKRAGKGQAIIASIHRD